MFEFNPNLRRTPPKAWYEPLTTAEWDSIPVAEDGSKSDSPFVTAEGRVYGTLAGLDSCYLNAVRQCIKPSRQAASYSMAQNRPKMVEVDGKEQLIKTGLISFTRGHVPNNVWERIQSATQPGSVQRYNELRRWYEGPDLTALADDVENAFATVRFHVDESRGVVYYTGAVVAHRSDADIEMARSAAVSGDWLRLQGMNERQLAGVCLVNSGAYRNSVRSPRLAAGLDFSEFSNEQQDGPDRVLMTMSGPFEQEDVLPVVELEQIAASTDLVDAIVEEIVTAAEEPCTDCDKNEAVFNEMMDTMPPEARSWMMKQLGIETPSETGEATSGGDITDQFTEGSYAIGMIDGRPYAGAVGSILNLNGQPGVVFQTFDTTIPGVGITTNKIVLSPDQLHLLPATWTYTTNTTNVAETPVDVVDEKVAATEELSPAEESVADESRSSDSRLAVKRFLIAEKLK